MELIHEQPVRWTHERIVACDGGGGPTGHPRVFINTDKPEIASCTYCGLPYVCDTDEDGFFPMSGSLEERELTSCRPTSTTETIWSLCPRPPIPLHRRYCRIRCTLDIEGACDDMAEVCDRKKSYPRVYMANQRFFFQQYSGPSVTT